jgi:uncharacterized OB-fold protein
MSYLSEDLPAPQPGIDDAPYWAGCNRKELLIQRCTACSEFRFPPSPACPHCSSFEREWVASSGDGTVYTFTWVSHAPHPALKNYTPYNVILVELDDAPGVRIVSNAVNAHRENLQIGAPVSIAWEEVGGNVVLPRFRLL